MTDFLTGDGKMREDLKKSLAGDDGDGGGKKGKKKKGKKGKDEDTGPAIIKIGASEVVQKFDEQYDDYNDSWVARDETDNYKQTHDAELVKQEVMPILEE